MKRERAGQEIGCRTVARVYGEERDCSSAIEEHSLFMSNESIKQQWSAVCVSFSSGNGPSTVLHMASILASPKCRLTADYCILA
ncbi:unnamed protein product [Ilex paraguariensis]|uniref:Uncharacterized protein n=1 Tax=Ilex paraguariensis TaxID=185542 RepID=A0ABC8U852_9AQUA